MARLAKWLVVLTLVFALGWHWVILQSVAWVSMATEYSRVLPLGDALLKTFDSSSRCNLCKFVAEGKKAEQEKNLKKDILKLDFFIVQDRLVLFPPLAFDLAPPLRSSAAERGSLPPRPPPRAA